jgi:hypothetical protein
VAERRDEPGRIVGHAIEALSELPPVQSEAVARIVAAAARTRAQDVAPNEDDLLVRVPGTPRYRPRIVVAAAAVIVATMAGVEIWRATHSVDAPSITPAAISMPATGVGRSVAAATAASRDVSSEPAPVPTQFVFDGHARHVVLVGDFNNWDERATPLAREPGSALWSVTVPIQRGRHIYAYLVDSVWTLDRRAPVARDPDFGVTGSVILVGRP